MSTERDTTRVVRSWLAEGATELPDRVLDAVLDQLPATPQRRATWWLARRSPEMNNTAKLALGIAAVVVVALVGFNLFAGAGSTGGPGLGDPTPSSTPSPTPVAALIAQDPLEAGTYQTSASVTGAVRVTVTVPDGWSAVDGWVIVSPGGNEPPDGSAIRFASVGNVFADPFSEQAGLLVPQVGPTAQDLVDAMVNHPDWTTSAPSDITVDGYAGQRVRLTVPSDLSEGGGRFLLFRSDLGGDHWAFEPDQIFDFYVVDIEGERVVLEVFWYPGTSEEDLAELQAVVDSIQLEP